MMTEPDLKWVLEALLMRAQEPVSLKSLVETFSEYGWQEQDWRDAIAALQQDYAARAFELKASPMGYFLQTKTDYAPYIHRLMTEKPPKYSRALLETLAIIAYRQPVTRADIESIRGVALSSGMMKTLLERDWIQVTGHRDVPGKPALYGTTRAFLTHFNLNHIRDLPQQEEMI